MKDFHKFIFTPGLWLGEGVIKLNLSPDDLFYATRWKVQEKGDGGEIECFQEIQIKGLSEIMNNQFAFHNVTPGNFKIELDNPALGKVSGHGVITQEVIAWEFRAADLGFEGFEFYQLQGDGSYRICAEYATEEELRTQIRGKLWKQAVV